MCDDDEFERRRMRERKRRRRWLRFRNRWSRSRRRRRRRRRKAQRRGFVSGFVFGLGNLGPEFRVSSPYSKKVIHDRIFAVQTHPRTS